MSKTPRSPTESVASDFSEASIFCGVGSPRPKARLLSGTLFGHVEDAFDEKTLPIGYGCATETSPNAKTNEEKGTEEIGIDEDKSIAKNRNDEKDEENTAEENGEREEKKENGTGDEEETELGTEEDKGPMPTTEAVSL